MIKYNHPKHVKNAIAYAAYVKTQIEVNSMTGYDTMPAVLDSDDLSETPFIMYTCQVLSTLCKTLVLDAVTEPLYQAIACMDEDLSSYGITEIIDVFAFGLFMDYAALFSEHEQQLWRGRYAELFLSFNNDVCWNFHDFYSHFYEGTFYREGVDYGYLEEEMKLSYVFYADMQNGDVDLIGPEFMEQFYHFAKGYILLYRELISEIKRRKVVVTSA